jgi:hypothetical protein
MSHENRRDQAKIRGIRPVRLEGGRPGFMLAAIGVWFLATLACSVQSSPVVGSEKPASTNNPELVATHDPNLSRLPVSQAVIDCRSRGDDSYKCIKNEYGGGGYPLDNYPEMRPAIAELMETLGIESGKEEEVWKWLLNTYGWKLNVATLSGFDGGLPNEDSEWIDYLSDFSKTNLDTTQFDGEVYRWLHENDSQYLKLVNQIFCDESLGEGRGFGLGDSNRDGRVEFSLNNMCLDGQN